MQICGERHYAIVSLCIYLIKLWIMIAIDTWKYIFKIKIKWYMNQYCSLEPTFIRNARNHHMHAFISKAVIEWLNKLKK